MDLIIKVTGDVCFDICGMDTRTSLKDKIKNRLKDKHINKKIDRIVGRYLEGNIEECGYRYIFNEDLLKEFVERMIYEVSVTEEELEKESCDILNQVAEKIYEWNEVIGL